MAGSGSATASELNRSQRAGGMQNEEVPARYGPVALIEG